MPETRPLPNDEPASLVEARSVDRLCDRFEAAWRTGSRPAIEAFLADVPASARAAALRELIALEVEYRRRDGETPKPEDYETRFGESSKVIASVFEQVPSRGEGKATAESAADTPALSPTVELEEKGTWPAPELPGYDILGRLGAGGMGVVYKARQHSLNRVVALKLIRPDVVAGPRERARFRREAEAAARLRHPHVVQVHEIGEHHGQPFAVLELVEGHTLAKEVATGPLPIRESAALIEKLARAVQHAHDNGILHRDLKPGNVLLQKPEIRNPKSEKQAISDSGFRISECSPKIADFGLARWLGAPSDQTASGEVLGTPKYMAPEQAVGQLDQLSPATDIYALGAILYELLTGQPAFQGRTALETLEQVRTREPTAPRRLRREVPRDLEAICLKCLEKSPTARYASGGALADDLKRWLSGEPTVARPEGWPRWAWRAARRRLGAIVFAFGALLLVLAAYWLLYHGNGLSPEDVEAKQQEEARVQAISELSTGQPVEWLSGSGPPRSCRWANQEPTVKISQAHDGVFAIQSWEFGMLELLANPPMTHYQFSAEVRHDYSANLEGTVGIYCLYQTLAGSGGQEHSYFLFSFNDLFSQTRAAAQAPARNLIEQKVQMHREPDHLMHLYQLTTNQYFEPGLRLEGSGPWRKLAFEVTPGNVTLSWEQQTIGTIPRKRLSELAHKVLAFVTKRMDIEPAFQNPGALGLYVYKSSASFRNVWIKPLPTVP